MNLSRNAISVWNFRHEWILKCGRDLRNTVRARLELVWKCRSKQRSRDSLLVERRTRDRKVESREERRETFLLHGELPMLTLIRCPFNPVLPQWHVKDPGYSGESADGSLHLNTHTSLTQRSPSGLTVLSRHSVGTYQGKRAHTQLVKKHSATVVSARWTAVDWSWPLKKKWNWCARAISAKKKKF